MVSVSVLNYGITFTCLVGLGLSIYAYIVELQIERDSNYKAMCDISEQISCSKAFQSNYGKGFGLFGKDSMFNKPNSLLGILFYSLTATLAQSNSYFITVLSAFSVLLANLSSLYFAYILYFVLRSLCIVCVSTYVVNVLCFILCNYKLKNLKAQRNIDAKKKRH